MKITLGHQNDKPWCSWCPCKLIYCGWRGFTQNETKPAPHMQFTTCKRLSHNKFVMMQSIPEVFWWAHQKPHRIAPSQKSFIILLPLPLLHLFPLLWLGLHMILYTRSSLSLFKACIPMLLPKWLQPLSSFPPNLLNSSCLFQDMHTWHSHHPSPSLSFPPYRSHLCTYIHKLLQGNKLFLI